MGFAPALHQSTFEKIMIFLFEKVPSGKAFGLTSV
jgi:hypothetical protein